MSDHDAVLFANEAFYRAFADRDYKAMAALWSRAAPVTCLHPGWAALIGRDEVLESWRRILAHDASPKVVCRRAHAELHGETALVLCYEEIDGQLFAATNIFRREGRHWLMVHHQSGPTAAQLPPEDEDEEEAEPAPRPN
jgi:hypothetical protein